MLVIWALVAVVTVPSVPTAMGREVGTVTDRAVAAESPSKVPSEVEVRVTAVSPEPPAVSISVAKAAVAKFK